ncbi:hypothetical protein BaRGS_00020380 [Batillaria attramentaria]|uniref:Uncharacterized protein n=1 Tax=Batillaria attramentaria TaxID=370345 RepID=A0ABD0KNB8_9CAEN
MNEPTSASLFHLSERATRHGGKFIAFVNCVFVFKPPVPRGGWGWGLAGLGKRGGGGQGPEGGRGGKRGMPVGRERGGRVIRKECLTRAHASLFTLRGNPPIQYKRPCLIWYNHHDVMDQPGSDWLFGFVPTVGGADISEWRLMIGGEVWHRQEC